MAAGIVIGKDGKPVPVIAISGFHWAIPEEVADICPDAIPANEIVGETSIHAEMRLIMLARKMGGSPNRRLTRTEPELAARISAADPDVQRRIALAPWSNTHLPCHRTSTALGKLSMPYAAKRTAKRHSGHGYANNGGKPRRSATMRPRPVIIKQASDIRSTPER